MGRQRGGWVESMEKVQPLHQRASRLLSPLTQLFSMAIPPVHLIAWGYFHSIFYTLTSSSHCLKNFLLTMNASWIRYSSSSSWRKSWCVHVTFEQVGKLITWWRQRRGDAQFNIRTTTFLPPISPTQELKWQIKRVAWCFTFLASLLALRQVVTPLPGKIVRNIIMGQTHECWLWITRCGNSVWEGA